MPLYVPASSGSGGGSGGVSGIAINGTSFSSWTDGYIHAQDNRLSIYDNLTNVMYFDDEKLLQRIYMSTLGNTSGSTGFAINRLVFVGGSNVTLEGAWSEANTSPAYSKASGTISIHAGRFIAGVSTGGATTGYTGTVDGRAIFYAAGHITLNASTSSNSITVGILGRNWMDGIFDESGTTTGNYVGSVQVLSFRNSNGISFNVSGAGVYGRVIASYNPFNAGISTGGNTAGDSGTKSGQLILAGGSNVTLSQASGTGGNTITIIAAGATGGGGGFSAGISTGGNTSGTSGTNSVQLVLAGGNNITLSQASGPGGNTVTISGAAGGGGLATIPSLWFNDILAATWDQMNNGTYWVRSTFVPGYMELAKVGVGIYVNALTNNFTLSMSLRCQLFTKTGSTLSPIASGSTLITQPMWSSADTRFSLVSGMRFVECPLSYTLSTGGQIFLGVNISTTRTGYNLSPRQMYVIGPNINNWGWYLGEAGNHLLYRGCGTYSATTNGTLASIAITNIGFPAGGSTWRAQPLIYLTNSQNWP